MVFLIENRARCYRKVCALCYILLCFNLAFLFFVGPLGRGAPALPRLPLPPLPGVGVGVGVGIAAPALPVLPTMNAGRGMPNMLGGGRGSGPAPGLMTGGATINGIAGRTCIASLCVGIISSFSLCCHVV